MASINLYSISGNNTFQTSLKGSIKIRKFKEYHKVTKFEYYSWLRIAQQLLRYCWYLFYVFKQLSPEGRSWLDQNDRTIIAHMLFEYVKQ
jgi:hypothetical protein